MKEITNAGTKIENKVGHMKFLNELIKENGHKLVLYNKCQHGREYMTVFNYSKKYGGTYDSFKYYNNYVVEI